MVSIDRSVDSFTYGAEYSVSCMTEIFDHMGPIQLQR